MCFLVLNQVVSAQLAMGMTRLLEMYLISGCMWYFFSGLERKEEELGSFSASFPQANSNSNLTGFFFFLLFLYLGKGRTQEISKEKKKSIQAKCPGVGIPCSVSQGVLRIFCVHCLFSGHWQSQPVE